MPASPSGPWLRWLTRQQMRFDLLRWDRIRFAGMAPQFVGRYRALPPQDGWRAFVWIEEN